MEKVNNLSGRSENLKGRSWECLSGRSENLKGRSWECANFSFERDRSFGFSWPQRNYNCNFCKKEFKSAQALGGHMNVHRRDRAKQLIQHSSSSSSSEINATLPSNPNPNPILLSTPPPPPPPPVLVKPAAARFLPYINYTAASAQEDGGAVSPQIREIRKKLAMEANFRYKGFKKQDQMGSKYNHEARVGKKKRNEFLSLDLNMITNDHEIRDTGEEDLDLELRLGRF